MSEQTDKNLPSSNDQPKEPPKVNAQELKKAPEQKKMIRCKAIYPIRVKRTQTVTDPETDLEKKVVGDVIIPAGTECQLTEKEAAEFCDTKYPGVFPFAGVRESSDETAQTRPLVRARRL